MHHWLLPVCALTGDGTPNPGELGQCSTHLSYLPRLFTGLSKSYELNHPACELQEMKLHPLPPKRILLTTQSCTGLCLGSFSNHSPPALSPFVPWTQVLCFRAFANATSPLECPPASPSGCLLLTAGMDVSSPGKSLHVPGWVPFKCAPGTTFIKHVIVS